jgi:predicted transcriptional regulator
MSRAAASGDDLLEVLAALASPHRLRIVAELTRGRAYVSELARRLEMNRPLLYLHLQRLEAAGLVRGALETTNDGNSVKYFEVTPFTVTLTPEVVAAAVRTLSRPARARQEEGTAGGRAGDST